MQLMERYSKEYARDYALRVLKANIISLDLAPGSMLSEGDLAAQLGLSRTPVREALIELAKTNIVEVLPQCGCRICLIDHNMVTQSRFLRLVLEKAVVQLACESPVELDLSEMEENLKLQQFYLDNHAPGKLLELDDKFHRELFRVTNMMQTYQLMDSMMVHFNRVRSLTLWTIKDTKIVEDHKQLLQAIRERDTVKAQALITKHLDRSKVDEDALQKKNPQYFK